MDNLKLRNKIPINPQLMVYKKKKSESTLIPSSVNNPPFYTPFTLAPTCTISS